MDAWLIEKEDLANPGCTTSMCLGITDRGKISNLNYRPEWTIPDLALRFCREEDARLAAQVLAPNVAVLICGHIWVDE